MRDELRTLDREDEILGRLFAPGLKALGLLCGVERPVQFDGIELA
jgi:hypothetical protein